MRMIGTLLLVGLITAACTVEQVDQSSSAGSTPTTIQVEGDGQCPAASETLATRQHDLDGAPPDELVYLRAQGTLFEVGICSGADLLASAGITGRNPDLLGFADLDGDATEEILVVDTTAEGHDVVQAATWTLYGLMPVDLGVERWIEGGRPEVPDGAFAATGFECDDIDDDGRLELLTIEYIPAEAVVHLGIAAVRVDGTDVSTVGVDSFELGIQDAHDRWSVEPTCQAAGEPRVDVRLGANGWGRVSLASPTFHSGGEIVIRAIAGGDRAGALVMGGVERKSPLVGEFFEDRPVIWHSSDGLTWIKVDLGVDRGEIRDFALLDDGSFIAVGRSGVRTGTAWLSADGVTWNPVEVGSGRPDELAGTQLTHVDVVDGTVFVTGTEAYTSPDGAMVDLDPGLWSSEDGGRTWNRIVDPAFGEIGYQPNTDGGFNGELFGVAKSPDGPIVAIGSASSGDATVDFPVQSATAWVSDDGVSWERVDLDPRVRVLGITVVESTLLAFGVTGVEADGAGDGAIVLSDDGHSWTLVEGDFSGIGEPDGVQQIVGVLALPDGRVLALGHDDTDFESAGAAAVWQADSSDLTTWSRVAHDDTVFGDRDEPSIAVMMMGVATGEEIFVVGIDGRAVELDSGVIGCCVAGPAIWTVPEGQS